VSRELNQIFDGAERIARELKDEYTSTEHLLLGIAAQKGSTARTCCIIRARRRALRDALESVRGSHRVTDQTPEQKYRALERFTKDLTSWRGAASWTR
jgi:ATP-dependent Clp protease ATP-binding subunit ClpB